MLKIKIPKSNFKEREYIIHILLNNYLGLKYKIEVSSKNNYEIILNNGNKLIIEDHFFCKFSKPLLYLQKKNLPKIVKFIKNPFTIEDDIPVIYGTDKFLIKEYPNKLIECGIDIFASSFFMLTRWEEYVNKIKDKHGRFPGRESIAYKFNFLHRPVVNEYVEMLWNMLKFLEINQKRKEKKFKIVLTHDVDSVYKYNYILSGTKELVGDIIKRRNFLVFWKNLVSKVKFHINLQSDPFDTYDYLMDISERLGIKSYFFFHSSTNSCYDKDNIKYLGKLAERILRRGHYIGFHPGYKTYNNPKLFKEEKENIEKVIGLKLRYGRQHYLRFEIPTTWQIWEDNNMEWDSTLGYADEEGFRCGTCYSFNVFNILKRKMLKLKEKPLIVMEATLACYKQYSSGQMKEKILNLMEKVKKYEGEFVFLWHNSSFNTPFWEKYKYIYEEILRKLIF